MVLAAKFAKVEKELRAARSYELSAKGSQKMPIEIGSSFFFELSMTIWKLRKLKVLKTIYSSLQHRIRVYAVQLICRLLKKHPYAINRR